VTERFVVIGAGTMGAGIAIDAETVDALHDVCK
jgi:3-hydroxyacyl-CoA dehydrogenase